MSDDLHIPVDFERTHEFRLLVNALKSKPAPGKVIAEKSIEASAVFIYVRLFVDLAFLARTTNRPGYLTKSGRLLFESTLDPLFGAESIAIDVLKDALLLEVPQSGAAEDGELYCPIFAQLNSHFAGNYMSPSKKGNVSSLIERQKRVIAQQAQNQAMLLPPETFRKPGTEELMNAAEINRAMAMIITLDKSLGISERRTQQFTEAMVGDAYTVSAKYAREPEVLKEVYVWIINNRTNHLLPKTTEQILKDFETVERMARR